MKEKVMSAMQAFSKAMFMPVLILPIAGLLIAVGNVLTNARLMEILPFLDNPVTKGFGTILSGALVAILNNLGLIFCTGIAIGLAKKKKAEAGFTALLAFLVFINAMNKFMGLRGCRRIERKRPGSSSGNSDPGYGCIPGNYSWMCKCICA